MNEPRSLQADEVFGKDRDTLDIDQGNFLSDAYP